MNMGPRIHFYSTRDVHFSVAGGSLARVSFVAFVNVRCTYIYSHGDQDYLRVLSFQGRSMCTDYVQVRLFSYVYSASCIRVYGYKVDTWGRSVVSSLLECALWLRVYVLRFACNRSPECHHGDVHRSRRVACAIIYCAGALSLISIVL